MLHNLVRNAGLEFPTLHISIFRIEFTMTDQYDVLIVGGGMVGSALACALGGSELKVGVVEGLRPPAFEPTQDHDLRVSALSIASQTILQTVGAWESIESMRMCPFRRMRVWENKGDTTFRSEDIQRSELGHIVENRVIQLALLDRLTAFDNVDLICPAKTRKIDYSSETSTVELEDGQILLGRLLVAADGAQSRVRQAAGIGVVSWDYQQHAMVISVETESEQQDITWQRFVPSGPQALLPLTGSYASLVWYHNPDEIKRLRGLSNESLLDELLAAFPNCLGDIKSILGRASFPLKRQHAQTYVKPAVALIGDAAHTINPLAGQGVNIGFLDAAALAQILVDANAQGQDIASLEVLQRYESMRRRENLLMMTVMDMFYRVFSNSHKPLQLVRNLGLGVAHRLLPAKTKIMRYAIGLDGNLPKLAKGEAIIL